MKIKQPEPFTFEAGPRAVLLLHGFTGHSADVRMMGRFLEKKGYTTHAPIYRGHGLPPEKLIKANPDQWWEDVQNALQHLRNLGYKEIAVAGLSLGGVLGLKLAYSEKIKAMITMCAPAYFDNATQLTQAYKQYAKEYKQLEGKDNATIKEEVADLVANSANLFDQLASLITEVKQNVDMIYTPTFVAQAKQDEIINPESANFIYDNVETDNKHIKWYESSHVITLGNAKDTLHEDVYQFLESLEWDT